MNKFNYIILGNYKFINLNNQLINSIRNTTLNL